MLFNQIVLAIKQHFQANSVYEFRKGNERTPISRAYKVNYIYSIVSIFSFLTKGLLIFSGIQLGLFFGASTICFHALKTCTFFVPRSLRRMISGFDFVPLPRFAAFKAACRGCFPVKIPCSLPSLSRKTKFLMLDIKITS